MGKPAPAAFERLCRGLHQDVLLEVRNPSHLATAVVRGVPAEQHAELLDFLRSTIERSTAAELKGLLNRTTPDLHFTTKGAEAFLAAVVAALAPELRR